MKQHCFDEVNVVIKEATKYCDTSTSSQVLIFNGADLEIFFWIPF